MQCAQNYTYLKILSKKTIANNNYKERNNSKKNPKRFKTQQYIT